MHAVSCTTINNYLKLPPRAAAPNIPLFIANGHARASFRVGGPPTAPPYVVENPPARSFVRFHARYHVAQRRIIMRKAFLWWIRERYAITHARARVPVRDAAYRDRESWIHGAFTGTGAFRESHT